MVTPKDLANYRQAVEEAVVALGRNEVGVSVEDGGDSTLAVAFSRGAYTHTTRIPLDASRVCTQRYKAITLTPAGLALGVGSDHEVHSVKPANLWSSGKSNLRNRMSPCRGGYAVVRGTGRVDVWPEPRGPAQAPDGAMPCSSPLYPIIPDDARGIDAVRASKAKSEGYLHGVSEESQRGAHARKSLIWWARQVSNLDQPVMSRDRIARRPNQINALRVFDGVPETQQRSSRL